MKRQARPTPLPPPPKLKVGETWKVHDVRKGDLMLKLTLIGDGWADGEIIEGKVNFASGENNLLQRVAGLGTRGDVITVSFALCKFVEKVLRPSRAMVHKALHRASRFRALRSPKIFLKAEQALLLAYRRGKLKRSEEEDAVVYKHCPRE